MLSMLDKDSWSASKLFWKKLSYHIGTKGCTDDQEKGENSHEKLSRNINCCGCYGQEGHNKKTCNFFSKDG